jgi:hypothetical protein
MKWGKAYGADYANILFSMVRRNTTRPLRFICFTDDATGLSPEIEALPLPESRLPSAISGCPGARSLVAARLPALRATCSSSTSMSW